MLALERDHFNYQIRVFRLTICIRHQNQWIMFEPRKIEITNEEAVCASENIDMKVST